MPRKYTVSQAVLDKNRAAAKLPRSTRRRPLPLAALEIPTGDFLRFRREFCPVEGDWGPVPIIPPWLEAWYALAFPDGKPAARNIMDCRSKKEGKTSDAAAVALYMAARRPYAEVVLVASDLVQARDRCLKALKFAVDNGPFKGHAKVALHDVTLENKSVIQIMSGDWAGAAGGNYDCVVFDELHTYIYEKQRRLFDELIIPPSRPDGVRWIASYAGWIGESALLEDWWNRALQGERVHDELPIYRNDEASLLAFVDTGEESWRMPWLTPAYIAEIRQSERPNTFRRLWLNQWVAAESQFVSVEQWEACRDSVAPYHPKDGRRYVLGVDAATTRDYAALVGVAWDPALAAVSVPLCRVWKPVRGESRHGKPTIDLEATIGEAVRELQALGQVEAIVVDPYALHTLVLAWEGSGLRVTELPQNAGRAESDQQLFDAIQGRLVRHYGDPALTEGVLNAVAIETPRGLRLAKEKTSLKIDAAVALSMALWGFTKDQGFGPGVPEGLMGEACESLRQENPWRMPEVNGDWRAGDWGGGQPGDLTTPSRWKRNMPGW